MRAWILPIDLGWECSTGVNNPSASRIGNHFFSLHHLLPFILVGASILHLAVLHQYGSNNPLGVHSEMDKIASYPYFYVKDLVGWVAFAIFFSIWIFYAPNVLGHPDNYIPTNPMSTPPYIVPEWYFLPINAILRSIPDKSGGVATIALVFICLLALPFFKSMYVRRGATSPLPLWFPDHPSLRPTR